MPGYVGKALKLLQHTLKKKQQQTHPSVSIKYGVKKQYAADSSPTVDKGYKKFIQQVCRYFFIPRTCSQQYTALPNKCHCITVKKSNRRHTMRQTKQLLDYIAR